jgi:hypothetical protein
MSPCVIELGRYGDILNILPFVESMRRMRPTLVVAEEFKQIGQSISYADVISFPGQYHQHAAALDFVAGKKFGKLYTPQVYGDGIFVSETTESFCAESYARVHQLQGFLDGKFDQINIDRRHLPDESRLVEKYLPRNGLPNILVNVTGGHSSPFPHGRDYLGRLQTRFTGRVNVINLAAVHANRFTDLLALYDNASALVTADTGTLHLAGAHRIPYVAFIQDSRPWLGAHTRGNCVARIRYRSAGHWVDYVPNIIEAILSKPGGRRIVHVYSKHVSSDPKTRRRLRVARQSWITSYQLGNWTELAIADSALPRMFQDKTRRLPFVKDLIDRACEGAADNDLIVLTNADVCFSPQLTDFLQDKGLVVGWRRDTPSLIDPLSPTQFQRAFTDGGADLFALTPEWWRANRAKFPDMVLGATAWDVCMTMLMRQTSPVAETKDHIYHEGHEAVWNRPQNVRTIPSQLHNSRLAGPFLRSFELNPQKYGVANTSAT